MTSKWESFSKGNLSKHTNNTKVKDPSQLELGQLADFSKYSKVTQTKSKSEIEPKLRTKSKYQSGKISERLPRESETDGVEQRDREIWSQAWTDWRGSHSKTTEDTS